MLTWQDDGYMRIINKKDTNILPVTPGLVEQKIQIIRGQKVMLDSDLAELYGVETKQLNRAVQRNIDRFPQDFMFQLVREESDNLKYQFGTSSWGGKRKPSYAFTELGVAMLSSVLKSDRAVQVNIYIMRAFVKLREIMATNKEVAEKIIKLEEGHQENREDIDLIAGTLKRLMDEESS
jgi:phage regulator Rha-like protein